MKTKVKKAEINQNIALAAKLLKEGNVVAIPTETVYGLAANALNDQAVISTYEIKERPRFNPFIVHCHSIKQIESFVHVLSVLERQLYEKFSPGPLTLLIQKNNLISDLVTAGSPLAGFRIPNQALTLSLLQQLDFPLTAPSANKFGNISPTSPQDVERQLGDEIKLILDGGMCPIGIESTVAKVEGGKIFIFREGAITREMLAPYGEISEVQPTERLHSPGRIKYHYSPDIPTYIYNNEVVQKSISRSAMINFQFEKKLPFKTQLVLSESGQLDEAARNIFRFLNLLNTVAYEKIYIELVPHIGIGRAINDKIRKATAKFG